MQARQRAAEFQRVAEMQRAAEMQVRSWPHQMVLGACGVIVNAAPHVQPDPTARLLSASHQLPDV